MALNQLATVSVPQPRMISVQVWDRSMVNAVEKAIMAANLGLTPSSEGQVIHLRIPELNEERRKELVKVAHKYAETAKVAVRHVRRDGMDVLKKMEKDHEISEDDHKRMDTEVQKTTDQTIVDIDHLLVGQGKGDHDGLTVSPCRRSPDPTVRRIRRAAPRRHHHGWQRALGFGARAAARRRGTGAASRRCARPCAPPAKSASRFLTIFSFSAENWSRPPSEIRDLMGLLRRFIRNDLAELHQNGVKVRVIGERGDLDPDIRRLLEEAEELTRDNDGLTLVVAFNYGARQEIARARGAHRRRGRGRRARRRRRSPPRCIGQNLDAPDLPDPDLIIRTSGEQRLSNFLLWQAAYSELVFVPTYWPDFDRAALEGAIAEYHRRERRFGGLIAQTGS